MPAPKGNQYAKGCTTNGRPTDYTQDAADLICTGIIEGHSIRKICEPDDMPDQSTVFRWLNANEDFQKQYAHAKDMQTTAMAEEVLEIADQYDTAKETLLPDLIQRAKLRIDTRKWLMSKMAPKKYGDKVVQEHTGADGKDLIPEQDMVETAKKIAFVFNAAKHQLEDENEQS